MAKQVWFRFYEELNDFLPSGKRKISFPYTYTTNQSVKDAIEAIGVPHVEIDLILVNSRSVDFSYKLNNDDYISVYPVFESLDITPVTHLRARALRNLKFIADVHLGKLAKYMRLCGFDTYFDPVLTDDVIIRLSIEERRVILTRDVGLLKNGKVIRGYWIRSIQPGEQLKEIIIKFDLRNRLALFTRCMECNTVLEKIEKETVINRLMPKTRDFYNEFKLCPGCNRVYWEGSHYKKMKEFVNNLVS